jgi:outer membrane protein assembly factor BamB
MNEDYLLWGHECGKGAQRGQLRTGKQGYGGTGGGSYSRSSAVVHGDMVYQAYAGGSFEGGDADYAAYKAAYIKDMKYKYMQYTEEDLEKPERTGCFSSPAIWNDQLLIGLDSGRLESYALEDGTVTRDFFKADEAIRSPITVSTGDNMAYFGSWDDHIYGIDAKTGKKRWAIKTGGNVDTAVCVDDGRLFVGSDDGKVYCIEGSE